MFDCQFSVPVEFAAVEGIDGADVLRGAKLPHEPLYVLLRAAGIFPFVERPSKFGFTQRYGELALLEFPVAFQLDELILVDPHHFGADCRFTLC